MSDRRPFDEAHKSLFSHKRLVIDLLLGFFPDDWIKDLDFTTLTPYPTEFIAKGLRRRNADVIWQVKFKGQNIYICILIEGQSSIDQFMSVRVAAYSALTWLNLIKHDEQIRKSKQLPPILPIVVYNGSKVWDAPLSMKVLIDDRIPETLKELQPNAEYWVLNDIFCKVDDLQSRSENIMAQIILTEQAIETEDVVAAATQMEHLLGKPEDESLKDAYYEYLTYVMKKDGAPPSQRITNIDEVRKMAIGVKGWIEKAKREGIAEGEARGKAEAAKEVALRLLSEGLSIDVIVSVTNLSVSEIEALQQKKNH